MLRRDAEGHHHAYGECDADFSPRPSNLTRDIQRVPCGLAHLFCHTACCFRGYKASTRWYRGWYRGVLLKLSQPQMVVNTFDPSSSITLRLAAGRVTLPEWLLWRARAAAAHARHSLLARTRPARLSCRVRSSERLALESFPCDFDEFLKRTDGCTFLQIRASVSVKTCQNLGSEEGDPDSQ